MLLLWRLVSFSTDGGKHQQGVPRHIISDTQVECIYIKYLILLNTFQTIKHSLVIPTVLWSYGDCLTGGANPQVHLYALLLAPSLWTNYWTTSLPRGIFETNNLLCVIVNFSACNSFNFFIDILFVRFFVTPMQYMWYCDIPALLV
jgi:hypothetical protein